MKKPNILFIMTDQQRYDCVGANGNNIINTPNIDKLAKESANFNNFFIQAPVCVPSRQTYFSGRYPHSHKNRVNYTSMDRSEILIQERLQTNGYKTGFVGKLHYFPQDREFALSTGFDCGLLHDAVGDYSDYEKWLEENGYNRKTFRNCSLASKNPFENVLPIEYHETTWCGENTRRFINDFAKDDEPFFLFSSYWRPHAPFEVPYPYSDMYNDINIEIPDDITKDYIDSLPEPVQALMLREEGNPCDVDREKLLWQYRAYYGAISHIDHEVGLTIDLLKEKGLYDDTIIIFCSDHGDFMNEHGMVGKNAFFEAAIKVPFMIRYKDHIIPGEYNDLTESTDVLSTLFELIGLDVPYTNQGRSFARMITDNKIGSEYKEREFVFAENIIPEVITVGNFDYQFIPGEGIAGIKHPDAKMIRTKEYKLNYYVGNKCELYDVINDPCEKENLIDDDRYKDEVSKLKGYLLDFLITADEKDQIAPRWDVIKDYFGNWVSLSD